MNKFSRDLVQGMEEAAGIAEGRATAAGVHTAAGDRTGAATGQGGAMTKKLIPVAESFAKWRKDPAYVRAYDELEAEFALAEAMLRARAEAGLTQEQLAARCTPRRP